MARRPGRRLPAARGSYNEKRRLCEPHPGQAYLDGLAARARLAGSPKHKLQPRAFGLDPFTGLAEDPTYCDGHAEFSPDDMVRVPELLRRGIEAGLVGANDAQGDPTLLWTVDDNGWIYEARITIPGQGLYHAYPVLPVEAIARKVIARFAAWAYDRQDAGLIAALRMAQERYG